MIEVVAGVICVLVAVVILIDSGVRTSGVDLRMRRERNAILSSAISMTLLIIYPIIFYNFVGFDSLAVIGLCWTVTMMLYDQLLLIPESKEEDQSSFYSTSTAANVVVGASWAVGSLIHAISRTGMKADGAKILLVSLILSVSFILSAHSKNDRGKTSTIVRTAQRNTLHIAVGLFISGIILSF